MDKQCRAEAPIEIEKKYHFSSRLVFDKVKAYLKTIDQQLGYAYEIQPKQKQIDTYFDTNNGILDQHNCTLRIREKAGKYELTIKKPVPGQAECSQMERLEIQKLIKQPSLSDHRDYICRHLTFLEQTDALTESLVIENNREPVNISAGSLSMEMALDDVVYKKNGETVQDFQLEIELKSDSSHRTELKRLSEDLEKKIDGLTVSETSKYRRGLEQFEKTAPAIRRCQPVEKKLILIRHGKADPREEVPEEAKRKLTEKGVKDFKKILPALESHFDGLKLQLVSSALPRAAQTAALIANHMGIEAFEQVDWVESGNYEGLLEAYQRLAPPFTLVVVGHEPHLSEWSRRLCGFRIPFGKGGAVGFRITSQEPLGAQPEWTLLPETVLPKGLKIKPCAAAVPEFRKILRFHCHEVFRLLQKFLETPGDPATVHQFRISIRTFRAALSFMKPLLDPTQYTAVQAQMRQLANQMGRLRELDVLKSKWSKFLKVYPLLHEGASVLSAALLSERQKEQDLVCADKAAITSTIFHVLTWVEDVLPSAAVAATEEEETSFAAFCQKRISSQLKKINAGVGKITDNEYTAIHQLRIRIKKLRYSLSILDPLLTLKRGDTIALLKNLQDIFGDYCDTHRNIDILEGLSTQDTSAEMRYESALIIGYQIRMMEEGLNKIKAVKALR